MPDPLPDFRDWSFLAQGSPDQRRAFAVLSRHRLFDRLGSADAVLAGTFPIDIAMAESDLDILVHADPTGYAPILAAGFGREAGFRQRLVTVTDGAALVANFTLDGMPIEIFVQDIPVDRQMGWRHMMVEARLLRLSSGLREAVRALKATGVKTEPAFARLLALSGDPYKSLLLLEDKADADLFNLLTPAGVGHAKTEVNKRLAGSARPDYVPRPSSAEGWPSG